MVRCRAVVAGAPRQRQAVVQASGEAFDPERLDARRGELDRERQAVKPSANLDDQRGVRIGEDEVFDDGRCTFDEQLHGGKGRRLGGRKRSRWLRAAERSQAVLVLTRYPERLPTGRQDGDAWRSGEKRRRQAGRLLDDVLTIVEQQEHPFVSKPSQQARKRIFGSDLQAEHGRDRARHETRVTERRQIGQPDAMLVAGDQALCDGERDCGLADAAGSDDRHQALARKPREKRRHRFFTADHHE